MEKKTNSVKFGFQLLNCIMNISKKISILILYFFIIHVYSFVHLHAHEHENQIEIHLSVHPPDLPIHEHHHEGHHCHSQHTGETDIVGEWNFTVQKIKTNVIFFDFFTIANRNVEEKSKVFLCTTYTNSSSILKYDLAKILPQRAPPSTS